MNRFLLALLSLFFSFVMSRMAAAETVDRSIRIIGRDAAHVTTAKIYLDDLANVSSKKISDDEAVIALKKIVIADAPAPGQKLTLSAQEILEKLRANGVDLNQVGFYLKRVIAVERSARTLSSAEVRAAIEEYLKNSEDEVVLRDIRYRDNVKVALGVATLKVSGYDSNVNGQMVFNIIAEVPDAAAVSFQVKGNVDEWKELPVAARPLRKGDVIGADDITMARLNVQSLPKDVASDEENLIGLETEREIAVGEVFRRNKLVLPPVVEKGATVMLVYNKGALTATATGVALAAAGTGETVKIKNASSKKVVNGTVVEAGLVRVNQ